MAYGRKKGYKKYMATEADVAKALEGIDERPWTDPDDPDEPVHVFVPTHEARKRARGWRTSSPRSPGGSRSSGGSRGPRSPDGSRSSVGSGGSRNSDGSRSSVGSRSSGGSRSSDGSKGFLKSLKSLVRPRRKTGGASSSSPTPGSSRTSGSSSPSRTSGSSDSSRTSGSSVFTFTPGEIMAYEGTVGGVHPDTINSDGSI